MQEDDLKSSLRRIVSEVSEVSDIPEEALFKDLGIDSMMAMEIVAEVERTYKLTIPENELQELVNLKAVYAKVQEKLASGAS